MENIQPLRKEAGKEREEEKKAREHFLLGMIAIRRKIIIEAVLEAK